MNSGLNFRLGRQPATIPRGPSSVAKEVTSTVIVSSAPRGIAGSLQPQKFSAIQTLLSTVGAGIATYFPLREGTAQLGQMLFTCQIGSALPSRSMYSTLCFDPA